MSIPQVMGPHLQFRDTEREVEFLPSLLRIKRSEEVLNSWMKFFVCLFGWFFFGYKNMMKKVKPYIIM